MSAGFPTFGVRSDTDVPGAVITVVELTDGLIAEYNGAGSIVSFVHPYGYDTDDYDDAESPEDRVKRLADELKEAKKALPRKGKAGAQ